MMIGDDDDSVKHSVMLLFSKNRTVKNKKTTGFNFGQWLLPMTPLVSQFCFFKRNGKPTIFKQN